jgi:hypothetical protein
MCHLSGRSLGVAFRNPPLTNHTEVMGRTGCLQLDAAFERALVEPVQHPLVLFRLCLRYGTRRKNRFPQLSPQNLKAFEKGVEYGITALTATASPADAELQVQYAPE